MKKKVLALVVLAAMLISILPMAAFAEAKQGEVTGAGNILADGKDYAVLKVTLPGNKGEQTLGVEATNNVSVGLYSDADATKALEDNKTSVDTVYVKVGPYTGEAEETEVTVTNTESNYTFDAHTLALNSYNSELSRVIMTENSAKANGKEKVEFDILLMGLGSQGATQWKSDDDPSDVVFVATSRGESLDQIKKEWKNDRIKVTITSVGATSSAKIAAGLGKEGEVKVSAIKSYLAGESGYTAMACQIIPDNDGNYTHKFTFKSVSDIAVKGSYDSSSEKAANGSNAYELVATVTDGGYPVSGKEVTFSINKSGASLTSYTATTNSSGQAKVKMTATKPGYYDVTVSCGDEEDKIEEIYFKPATVSEIKAASDDNQKIAFEKSDVTLKYNFYDGNNNKIAVKTAELATKWWDGSFTGNLMDAEIQVITKPSGSDLSADDLTNFTADDDSLKLVISKDDIDKEGDYEIKLALINGKAVTYKFNVKKQGTITGMTLKYDTTSLSAKSSSVDAGAKTAAPTVKLVDAEGYGKNADFGKLKFAVDNGALAAIGTDGIVEVASTDTGVVTVTVIDTDSKQVATASISIVKAPATLKVTADSAAAGSEAKLTVQLVDVDGQAVALGNSYDGTVSAEAVVLSKPSDSIVSVDDKDATADVKESGKFTLNVASNKAGEVKVQVILTAKPATGSQKVYTGSTTVTFGKDSGITGNDIIFMIGASSYVVDGKPVASTSIPFIENGRTYLGIRDMGMAMGIVGDANIVWDQAAQTAKLVKDGITVEVTVGATAIKVTKDNVTTEVAIDAPAQNKDGRVYLPFRAVFEAFGYSVEYANGTITCGK